MNTAVEKQAPIDLQKIDFDDIPVNPDVFTDDVDYNPKYDGVEGEHRFNYQYTNTMNPYPNTTFPNNFNPYPNNFNQQVSRHVVEETKKEESDQTSTSKNMLGMDWDENHEARFVKWVLDQKSIRQKEGSNAYRICTTRLQQNLTVWFRAHPNLALTIVLCLVEINTPINCYI